MKRRDGERRRGAVCVHQIAGPARHRRMVSPLLTRSHRDRLHDHRGHTVPPTDNELAAHDATRALWMIAHRDGQIVVTAIS